MEPSDIAAWVGAVTGLASFGWNIYTHLTSGPRLELSARAGIRQIPEPANPSKFLHVTVRNNGTVATTINTVSLHIYGSWWKRKRQKDTASFIIANFQGPAIPYKLEVGSEWSGLMKQDDRFDELVATDKLWCGVWYTFSRKPVYTKVLKGKG
jgi:hypothetical protein